MRRVWSPVCVPHSVFAVSPLGIFRVCDFFSPIDYHSSEIRPFRVWFTAKIVLFTWGDIRVNRIDTESVHSCLLCYWFVEPADWWCEAIHQTWQTLQQPNFQYRQYVRQRNYRTVSDALFHKRSILLGFRLSWQTYTFVVMLAYYVLNMKNARFATRITVDFCKQWRDIMRRFSWRHLFVIGCPVNYQRLLSHFGTLEWL